MFKDHKDRKPDNKAWREKKISTLMNAMRDPENNLKVLELASMLKLERRGTYICAFILMDFGEGEYDRTITRGDFLEELSRVDLFCAERNCIENRDGLDMNCAIPVLVCPDGFVIECTVINTETLPIEEKALVEKGYEASKIALENID